MKRILIPVFLIGSLFSFACTTQTWESEALAIAGAACPVAASIVTIAYPPATLAAGAASAGCEALVAAGQAAVKNASAGNVAAFTAAVNIAQQDASELLAFVKNPTNSAEFNALVPLFAQAIDEIAQIVQENTNTMTASLQIPASAISVKRTNLAKGWNAKMIKAEHNRIKKAAKKK